MGSGQRRGKQIRLGVLAGGLVFQLGQIAARLADHRARRRPASRHLQAVALAGRAVFHMVQKTILS